MASSPYINHFIQPDTIIPNPSDPQSYNRYSYVNNRPVNFNDPTGHIIEVPDDLADYYCTDPTYCKDGDFKLDPYANRHGNNSGNSENDIDEILSDGGFHDDMTVPDCWDLVSCREEWANNVGAFATLLDTGATVLNGGYALVGDIVVAVCAVCEVGVLGVYRFYSFIPNSISTLAMTLWIGQGVVTGENNFTITQMSDSTTISLSVSQDTIFAVGTNIAGWLIPEPNIAFGLDTIVAGYDYGRSDVIPFFPSIPTWINPAITYNTNSGFDFSWR